MELNWCQWPQIDHYPRYNLTPSNPSLRQIPHPLTNCCCQDCRRGSQPVHPLCQLCGHCDSALVSWAATPAPAVPPAAVSLPAACAPGHSGRGHREMGWHQCRQVLRWLHARSAAGDFRRSQRLPKDDADTCAVHPPLPSLLAVLAAHCTYLTYRSLRG